MLWRDGRGKANIRLILQKKAENRAWKGVD